ncbi:hypothetical protein SAMN05192560_1232 [Methylobacillus rhizosphaerae]|uniref:Uncharacterized protein n=1 Tax=Methylobacillus rhizosphaerae TaxID=551994 RepID=A0A238ZCP2_9PROT|nr:hypothetical protein SAMN05192560_1232 [Methylobacillus rhizosphaerae]
MKLLIKTLIAGYVAKRLTHYLLNHKKTHTIDA